jgi:colicin import membrane protein
MHAATNRLEFAPPPTPGLVRAMGLAVLAHLFLLAALTWGVHWKSEPVTMTAEAELWSAVPQAAAPRLVEVPPEPPTPPPKPVPVTPPTAEPLQPDADIALAQKKLRLKKEKELELEKQQLAKLKLEQINQEKLKQEKLKQEKLLLEKKQLLDKRLQDKRDQDKKAVEDKKKSDLIAKNKDTIKAQQEAQKLEAQREANLKRIAGLAGATGAPSSTGTAPKSSGPSASYAGKIIEQIKSNTNFTDSSAGKLSVVVLVRAASGGTILSRKVVTPSGNKTWDEAVLRAIDKMDTLPRDVDGRIPDVLLTDGLLLTVKL